MNTGKLGYYILIISIKASRANDTLFSRAFHTTSRYGFRAYDIRPIILWDNTQSDYKDHELIAVAWNNLYCKGISAI